MTVAELRTNLLNNLKPDIKSQASPFLDQGETHTFSDWLAVSLWNTGVDDPKEFYVGVFPDLSDFLVRDNGRVSIDPDSLKTLQKSPNNEFLKYLKPAIEGRWFFDFGAGRSNRSLVPRLVAQMLGAKGYVGVDICYSGDSLRKNEFSELGNFDSYFLKNNWLDVLENLKTNEPVFCFVAGSEFQDPQAADAQAAKKRVLDGFKSLKHKDHLMFGAGTTEFDWSDFPFKKLYSDHYHFLHRRKGPYPWSDLF